jgi:ferredoxin
VVEGSADPIRGFRRPAFGQTMGTWGARLVSRIYVTQPRADTASCIKCGACERQCPVDAIRMDPYPVIDAARCISCFCCHEFCKAKAMRLAPRIRLMKFLRGRK